MPYTVVFAPEAEDQIAELYRYIANEASPAVALNYTDAVISCCEALNTFPHRGTPRDDIRPGLRVTNYRGRTLIAYAVDDASSVVSILGVFYGGRDIESLLADAPD